MVDQITIDTARLKTRLTIDATGQFAWYYHLWTRYYRRRLRAMTTTVTTKGQVTIPKPVRDYLRSGPVTRVHSFVASLMGV